MTIVPFKRLQKLVEKLRHTLIGIPAGHYFPLRPHQPTDGHGAQGCVLELLPGSLAGLQKLGPVALRSDLRPNQREGTSCVERQIVGGTLDSSGEGGRGVWIPGKCEMAPLI